MIINYEIDDDRLLFVRLSDRKRRTRQRFTALGHVNFDPQGPLFAVCADKPLGHSVDLDDNGVQLTDTPDAYPQRAVPIALNWQWVEI